MPDNAVFLATATQAAQAAGTLLRGFALKPEQIREKAYRDLVTDADLASNKVILEVIKRDWADHDILSEEGSPAANKATWTLPAGYWWIVDPIDGTTNFSRGVPSWSVSIAVAQGETILAGVVYDVVRDQLFAAARGQGAALNGQVIHTNEQADINRAVCVTDFPPGEHRATSIKLFDGIMPTIRSLRSWGTSALGLAHVAAGYLDAYYHVSLKSWDAAAGLLLVQEAGGIVTALDGSPWSMQRYDILASNRPLHAELAQRFGELLA